MPRVTTAPVSVLPRCMEAHPTNPTHFCTVEDPQHEGDHEHEYSGTTWPREKRR